jgi:hypothetical protein
MPQMRRLSCHGDRSGRAALPQGSTQIGSAFEGKEAGIGQIVADDQQRMLLIFIAARHPLP